MCLLIVLFFFRVIACLLEGAVKEPNELSLDLELRLGCWFQPSRRERQTESPHWKVGQSDVQMATACSSFEGRPAEGLSLKLDQDNTSCASSKVHNSEISSDEASRKRCKYDQTAHIKGRTLDTGSVRTQEAIPESFIPGSKRRPEAVEFVTAEDHTVQSRVKALGVPKVRPDDRCEQQLTILFASWVYCQRLTAAMSKIVVHKKTFEELAVISEAIQGMTKKLKAYFGAEMPSHEWFENYGDRIFPEVLSLHLKQVDHKAILDAQKCLFRKWVWVIDYIRNRERGLLHNYCLSTSKQTLEFLEAMIRANWEVDSIERFLRLAYRFIDLAASKSQATETNQRGIISDWLVDGTVSTLSQIATREQSGVPEIQAILEGFDHQSRCFLPTATDAAGPESMSKPNWFPASSTVAQKFRKGRPLENAQLHFFNFAQLLVEPGTDAGQSRTIEGLLLFYMREGIFANSNLEIERGLIPATTLEGIRLAVEERDRKPVRTGVSGKEVWRDPMWTTYTACKQDYFKADPTRDDPAAHHQKRFHRIVGKQQVFSPEFQRFMYLLSSNEGDKLTLISFIKFWEVFELAFNVWEKDEQGPRRLMEEMLPLLLLGNDFMNHADQQMPTSRIQSIFRRVIKYVYCSNFKDLSPKNSEYINMRKELKKFKKQAKPEAVPKGYWDQ